MCSIALLLCLAATATTGPSLQDKCQSLAARWHERLAGEQMTCLISPPYVIAGDGTREQLAAYRDHSILAATRALQKTFFDKTPQDPILILLFESADPYERLSKRWFGQPPTTPYGYFRRDNIMVMNVATGTGTLVHELTHALIKPDFPDVPDWFNEGLGSLFEQCTLADNTIKGLPNWRLAALQKAIREDRLRPLRDLIEDEDFYGDDNVGLNYAQARYLLMYLQHRNELPDFYKRLRENHDSDPTGYATLLATIAPEDLTTFERNWKRWVLSLSFP